MKAEMEQKYKEALKKASNKINELLVEITDLKREEAVAVTGMSCRFPGGADNPATFWKILEEGVDTVSLIPSERWDVEDFYSEDKDAPGKSYTREGAFLDDVSSFDASFFGISPREAAVVDPQHRLLLEVSHEALESAGQDVTKLNGSRTGVFIGISSFDYIQNHILSGKKELIDAYALSGMAGSSACGRLSYFFGFTGPGMSINTACSSSLTALHEARQSLLRKEADLALAGGVSLILSPELFIGFSRLGAVSPDGRCKAFDDTADGYGRGEGCGVVVLKRLSDARRDGDPILAVIRETAVNLNGTSNGFTAPNALAQEKLIAGVLEKAGLSPADIDYVEAHGTGTRLGDSLEAKALAKIFNKNTRQSKLLIGSVKTNIGHLEAASGMAALIKVILALHYEKIPGNLHFKTPSSYISWEQLPIEVVTRLTPWKKADKPRLAGVNTFGFSGINAHAIVEEAPGPGILTDAAALYTPDISYTPGTPAAGRENQWHALSLSAKNSQSLKRLAAAYQTFLLQTTLPLGDICYTANTCRSNYKYRLAVLGQSPGALSLGMTKCLERWPENGSPWENPVENITPALPGDSGTRKSRLAAMANLYCGRTGESGETDVDWQEFYHPSAHRKVLIPTTPFHRQRCWITRPLQPAHDSLRNPDGPLPETSTENSEAAISTGETGSLTSASVTKVLKETIHDVSGLPLDSIDATATLLSLGLDSLMLVKVKHKIETTYAVVIAIEGFFTTLDTVEKIVSFIRQKGLTVEDQPEAPAPPSFPSLRSVEKKESYPVSAAQGRLFALHRFVPGTVGYNMPGSLVFEGDADIDSIREAFFRVIRRHDSLRTTFLLQEGRPRQRVHPSEDCELDVEYFDLTEQKEAGGEFSGETGDPMSAVTRAFIRPFELTRAPLMRIGLVKEGWKSYRLLLDMHHIVSDGVSMEIILNEFAALYGGAQPGELSKVSFQYKDFVVWHNRFVGSEAVQKQKQYWQDKYSGEIPLLNLHTDYPRPSLQSFDGDIFDFEIDRELTSALRRTAVQEGATLYMVLLAIYNILLARYSDCEDLIVGTPASGRRHPALEHIVGMFVNTLAVRNYPEKNKRFDDFLREVKSNFLEAFENQDYQFDELVEHLDLKKDVSRNPLFDTMFSLLNVRYDALKIRNREFKVRFLESKVAKFDITLQCREEDSRLLCSVEYCVKLFKKETMQRFAGHFVNIVREVTTDPGIETGRIRMISEVEEKQLLYEFNDTETPYPADKTVVDLFRRQVESTPDAVVLVGLPAAASPPFFHAVTYREMNAGAEALAERLRGIGVAKGRIVVIDIPRSIDLVTGPMGILQSGAAY
ncbi:MAG: AMP-binding protein, partial [bacterium]|nr:AMP-binding protein [bacterium]